jgi:hypothetical protein
MVGPATAMAMHKWGPKPQSPEQKRRAASKKGQGWVARFLSGNKKATPAAQALQPQRYRRPMNPAYMSPGGVIQRPYYGSRAAQRPYEAYNRATSQRSYGSYPLARGQSLYERYPSARESYEYSLARERQKAEMMARRRTYMPRTRPITQTERHKTPLSKRFFDALFTEKGATLHDTLFDN